MILLFPIWMLAFTLALAQDSGCKTLRMNQPPPVVQTTVQAEARGATIKSISKETGHGVVQYEVETMLGAKHMDLNVSTEGVLLRE